MTKREAAPIPNEEPTKEPAKEAVDARKLKSFTDTIALARRAIEGRMPAGGKWERPPYEGLFFNLHGMLAEMAVIFPNLSPHDAEAMIIADELPAAEIRNMMAEAEEYGRNGQKEEARDQCARIEEKINWWQGVTNFDGEALAEFKRRLVAVKGGQGKQDKQDNN